MTMSATPNPNAKYIEASRHRGTGIRVQKSRSSFLRDFVRTARFESKMFVDLFLF
jgi:hypothetical protein